MIFRGLVAALILSGLGSALPAPAFARPGPILAVPPGAAAGFNIVLVTLDTTRADRIGCYGYRRAATPILDRLAASGVRFAEALTAAEATVKVHVSSILSKLGVRDRVQAVLRALEGGLI